MFCVVIAAFAAALTVCGSIPALAAVPLYVAPSGDNANDGSIDNPLKSITHAVSLLGAGGEVRVLPGTYSATSTGETFPIQPGSVSIVAHDTTGTVDPANHVISGEDGTVILLQCNSGDNASLAGFTLGFTRDTPVVVQTGELAMTNCAVTDVTVNNSTYSGRATAVQVYTGGTLTATDCTFTATNGRGVIEGGGPGVIQEQGEAFVNDITLAGCTFTSNTSGNGALNVSFAKATFAVTDCLFEGNTSTASASDTAPASMLHTRGGAGSGTAMVLDRCRIIDNTGRYVINTITSTTISNSLIAGNTPVQTVMGGQTITPTLTNGTIAGNTTVRGGTERSYVAQANFNNCIISDNASLNSATNNVDGLLLNSTILWATHLAANVVDQARGVAVAFRIHQLEVLREPALKPQNLKRDIGIAQQRRAVPLVLRPQQGIEQRVEVLFHPLTQHEAVCPWKTPDDRHEPQYQVVCLRDYAEFFAGFHVLKPIFIARRSLRSRQMVKE